MIPCLIWDIYARDVVSMLMSVSVQNVQYAVWWDARVMRRWSSR